MKPDTEPDPANGSAPIGIRDATRCTTAQIRRRLLGLAVKLVWNRHDGEELVQETFRIGLTKGIDVLAGENMPWLMRTVANLAMNHRRRLKPQPLADQAAVNSGDETERLIRMEQLERLRKQILGLPDQQRLAITLRMLEERSYEEISEIMQLSISAVRTHVHLARRTLMQDPEPETR